jgi:hypothetical protein
MVRDPRCGRPSVPRIDDMTDETPGEVWADPLADATRDLVIVRSEGGPGAGLHARIIASAAETQQRHPSAPILRRWSDAWPARPSSSRLRIVGSIGVAAVVAIALAWPLLGGSPWQSPAHRAVGSSTPGLASLPADIPASNAAHVPGTCPVTPITRLAGGQAPEVDVSGLRWRWAGVPWVAAVDEKVVWLADAGDTPAPGVSVFATQLAMSIVVDGRTVDLGGATAGAAYAATSSDAGWVTGIRLPSPGCWLLTATWSQGASSVVVAARPGPGSAATNSSPGRPPAVSAPIATCPVTPPTTQLPGVGPAYVDGPLHWLLPPSQFWTIGGTGDKLVLDSDLGWAAGDKRVVAVPLAHASGSGPLAGAAVFGDLPPIAGGSMGVGITLPARDCWALVYLDAATTSTIVDDLRQPGAAARLHVGAVELPACASEGGCAAFYSIAPDRPEWRFDGPPTSLVAPAGAPTTIVPGTYRLYAHLNWLSDVIAPGATPGIGGAVSTCDAPLVVGSSAASVAVQVTFHLDAPCVIDVTTDGRPSP